jgi:hypothetical protein
LPEAWSALLHLLVFAYWLGGDVGAFAASFTLTDPRQPPAARHAAAKILNQVDMAPRSALILTLPTGMTLAAQRGWIAIAPEALLAIWIVSLVWLAAMWVQHASHVQSQIWRTADLALRLALIAGLCAAIFFTQTMFLQIKFACLGLAAALGVAIRFAVAPMSPSLALLARGETGDDANRNIAHALGIARPMVASIWICLLIAAWAGIAKPV